MNHNIPINAIFFFQNKPTTFRSIEKWIRTISQNARKFLSKLPLKPQKHQKLYAPRAGFDPSKFTIAPQYKNIIDDM